MPGPEPKELSSWWHRDSDKSFATVTSVERDSVHFRYVDHDADGNVFSGDDTLSVLEFWRKYPYLRFVDSMNPVIVPRPADPWGRQ